jgi:hypothetical protein
LKGVKKATGEEIYNTDLSTWWHHPEGSEGRRFELRSACRGAETWIFVTLKVFKIP